MYNINYTEEFNLSVTLLVDIFKLRNKTLAESYHQTFTALFSPEYATDMIMAAIFRLAATDPDTCHWILQDLSTLDACLNLLEEATAFAVKKLTGLGFILGQDFSINGSRKLLINREVKASLLNNVATTDQVFITEALQVIE